MVQQKNGTTLARPSITRANVPSVSTVSSFDENYKENPKSRCRAWCVTMWSEEDVGKIVQCAGKLAFCVGEETCPTTGKVHWHVYVRFDQPRRFAWWKLYWPTAHVQKRRGEEWQAAAYCRKDGKVLHDYGCDDGTTEVKGEAEDMVVVRKILKRVKKGVLLRQHWKTWYKYGHKLRPFYQDVQELILSGEYEEPPDIYEGTHSDEE